MSTLDNVVWAGFGAGIAFYSNAVRKLPLMRRKFLGMRDDASGGVTHVAIADFCSALYIRGLLGFADHRVHY
jgi:hypothetical protein